MRSGRSTHNSLLVLTWDEDDYSQSNQIPTLFVGALVIPGSYTEKHRPLTPCWPRWRRCMA